MKKLLAGAVMAVWFAPLSVVAQERAGDAALGALTGAVVLGPVGAVAGAVVGYTTGPAIARSWGMRGSDRRYQGRSAKRPPPAASKGVSARGADPQRTTPQRAAAETSSQPARPSAKSAGAPNAMPPVQPLE